MTGLIVLLILIPLIAFIILVIILNRTTEQQKLTESLYDRIKFLSEDIAKLTKEVRNLKQPVETKNIIVKSINQKKMKQLSDIIEPFRKMCDDRINKLEAIMKKYKRK